MQFWRPVMPFLRGRKNVISGNPVCPKTVAPAVTQETAGANSPESAEMWGMTGRGRDGCVRQNPRERGASWPTQLVREKCRG